MSSWKERVITLLVFALIIVSGILIEKTRKPGTVPQQENGTPEVAPVHHATLMSKSYFDDAYKMAPSAHVPAVPASGGIVSHHLLVAPLIAQFFEGLAPQHPKRVIILGPDHLGRGKKTITASIATFKTPYGDVRTDSETINALAKQNLASIEEKPFDEEHSIGALTPFVARSLEGTALIPIIIREDAKQGDIEKLIAALPTDSDTIFVASEDFSHYLPTDISKFHDDTSLAVVANFAQDDIPRLETDVQSVLTATFAYFTKRHYQQFDLIAETDGARATKAPNTPETTSYLFGYYLPGAPVHDYDAVTILAKGGASTKGTPEDRFNRGYDLTDADMGTHTIRQMQIRTKSVPSITEARKEIDAGSDIIFIDSPTSTIETYKSKPIIYGAGKQTIYGITLKKNHISIYQFPIEPGPKWWTPKNQRDTVEISF